MDGAVFCLSALSLLCQFKKSFYLTTKRTHDVSDLNPQCQLDLRRELDVPDVNDTAIWNEDLRIGNREESSLALWCGGSIRSCLLSFTPLITQLPSAAVMFPHGMQNRGRRCDLPECHISLLPLLPLPGVALVLLAMTVDKEQRAFLFTLTKRRHFL